MRLGTLQLDDNRQVVCGVDVSGHEMRFVDLHHADADLPETLLAVLALSDGLPRAKAAFESSLGAGMFLEGRLIAPVPNPGKILCIGLNYRDHAIETKAEIPGEPVVFGKFGNTIIGPGESIILPAVSSKVDYEAELVVVIGKTGKNIAQESALDYVAGYMNGHDVSARDWQKGRPGGQWLLGKTPDNFAPTGPYFVSADEIANPHDLRVQFRLNGETMQDGNTAEFIFNINEVIAHVSKIMTLNPGDLIFTGTPAGVGVARSPQIFLKPGDKAEVEIEGLGTLTNPVVAE